MKNKKYTQPHCKSCLLRTGNVLMSSPYGGDKEDYTIVDIFGND